MPTKTTNPEEDKSVSLRVQLTAKPDKLHAKAKGLPQDSCTNNLAAMKKRQLPEIHDREVTFRIQTLLLAQLR